MLRPSANICSSLKLRGRGSPVDPEVSLIRQRESRWRCGRLEAWSAGIKPSLECHRYLARIFWTFLCWAAKGSPGSTGTATALALRIPKNTRNHSIPFDSLKATEHRCRSDPKVWAQFVESSSISRRLQLCPVTESIIPVASGLASRVVSQDSSRVVLTFAAFVARAQILS